MHKKVLKNGLKILLFCTKHTKNWLLRSLVQGFIKKIW